MKILVDGRVLTHLKTTGVERYTKEILLALKKLGINFDVATPKFKNKFLQHLWEHIFLPKIASKYNILFCPGNIAPIIKPKNVKLVTVIHDLMFLKFPQYYSKMFVNYYKVFVPLIIKKSDFIITISENEKREIIAQYPNVIEKIGVVSCGISEKFIIEEDKIIFDKEDFILYVGSLKPSKNLKAIYETFIRLIPKISHKLYIVGSRSSIYSTFKEEVDLIKKIPKERIKYFDNLSDEKILELYKTAQCFIFPSFYEGFGLPLVEAMSCGCPVVASNTSSIPEILGDAGLMFDPIDYDGMASGILRIVNDKTFMINMIKKGLVRSQQYRWSDSAKKLVEIFTNLLNK